MTEVSPENATALKTEIRNRDALREFNLWIHDYCSHQMYAGDLDAWVLRMSKRVLRFFESKHWNEALSSGQDRFLPALSGLVALGIRAGLLGPGSGVFVVRGTAPFAEGAEIQDFTSNEKRYVSQADLIAFVDMRDVP